MDGAHGQKQHFGALVEDERFRWQTGNPYIVHQEKDLLKVLASHDRRSRLLEVGCGEGANLANLEGSFKKAVGVDFSWKRVAFCRKNVVGAQFGCGDAANLPFSDETFDVVFCRDVLHHVPDPGRVLMEMHRVCKPGGHLVLIEANGKNPIIYLQGRIIKIERDVLRASPESYLALLSKCQSAHVSLCMREPFPVFRILLHHKFGFPRFAGNRLVIWALSFLDSIACILMPKSRWAYILITATRPEMSF